MAPNLKLFVAPAMENSSNLQNKTIALFQLAIGKEYLEFFKKTLEANMKNLFPNNRKKVVLFTDQLDYENPDIEIKHVESTIWPYATLSKTIFIEDFLKENGGGEFADYSFYLDVDNVFIKEKEFFFDMLLFTSDWTPYYAGCFYGGKTEVLMDFISKTSSEIRNIVNNSLRSPLNNDEYFLWKAWREKRGFLLTMHLQKYFAFENGEMGEEKFILQLEKDNKKAHGLNVEIRHPEWTALCLIDLEKMVIVRALEGDSNTKIGFLGETDDEKVFTVDWEDAQELEYLFTDENRIGYHDEK